MLLLVVIVAICLGWYVDHKYRYRREIIDSWYYRHGGYRTTLVFRTDGTFTKTQKGRTVGESFEGTYKIGDGGGVLNVLKHEEFFYTVNGPDVRASNEMNEEVFFRWAISNNGYLLIHNLGYSEIADEMRLNREAYQRANAR